MFSSEFCEIFKNTFFDRTPLVVASVSNFFFRQDKLSGYVFVGLNCLLPEAAIRVEVSCKKAVLKDFINFIGKHLCWSPFLIKLQAWHRFWRTSTNDCFCVALAPLIVTYPFYFIFSTFFLIITATTVNISDARFWFKLKKKFYLIFTEPLSSLLFSVSGKLPPGKFPPIKLPSGKFPPRKFPPGIFPSMFLNV